MPLPQGDLGRPESQTAKRLLASTVPARFAYERFSQGDLEGALDLCSEDFVWEGASESDLLGFGGTRAKEPAIGVLRQTVGAWDKFALSADEFIERGDTVVVLGHTDVAKGDRSARLPVVHIWRYRGDGRSAGCRS